METTEVTHDFSIPAVATTPEYVDPGQLFFYIPLYSASSRFLGFLGNSLVCFVFLSRRSLRNQTNLLITNQAFVDLLSSVVLVVGRIYELVPAPPALGQQKAPLLQFLECYLWKSGFLLFASFAVSTFNLTSIALERWFAIIYPISYVKQFTRRRVKFLIAALWLFGPSFQYTIVAISVSIEGGVCVVGWSTPSIGVLLFFGEYLLPVCVMACSFVSITWKFRSMRRVLNAEIRPTGNASAPVRGDSQSRDNVPLPNQTEGEGGSNGDALTTRNVQNSVPDSTFDEDGQARISTVHGQSTAPPAPQPQAPGTRLGNRNVNRAGDVRRRNVTTTLLVVFAMFFVCWSPNQIAYFQQNLGGYLDFEGYFFQFSVVLAICNACINPFIYALRHKAYKDRVRELYTAIKRRFA